VGSQYIVLRIFLNRYRCLFSAKTLLREIALTFWGNLQIGFIASYKNRLGGSDFHQGSIFTIDNAFAKIGT